MNQILPHKLWIGHLGDGLDYSPMFELGIKALFTMAAEEENSSAPREMIYCHFPLVDGPENEEDILTLAIRTLADCLEREIPTLVCCGGGMSRSPAISAAALSLHLNKPLEQCLEQMAASHHIDVSPGLWTQIKNVTQNCELGGKAIMRQADNLPSAQLVGKRVAFKDGDDHRTCWHFTVGLKTGKVLRVALSLAEKAKIMEEGGIPAPQLHNMEEEEPRIWVKADPCPTHPRGCEVAVDRDCLLLIDK